MMWRDGEVLDQVRSWGRAGMRCAELDVRVTAAPRGSGGLRPGARLRAVAYEALTGLPEPGERVRLEVSALDRALGTGGHAMVAARPDALPEDPPGGGHLVKVRYMPDQVMVTGVDEQGAEHHGLLSAPVGELELQGCPVVVADLHSSLPAILAGIRACSTDGAHQPSSIPARQVGAAGPGTTAAPPRVVYVMSDGGALPLPYSRAVAGLQEAGWLTGTVSAGQAWGGDVEAVSVHNALLAARHVLGAHVIVLIQGPGNLGTDTPWGFSGLACGEAVNAVAALGGRAVACLRVSQADPRSRHRGVSHHSLTAYGRVALAGADVVVPALPGELGRTVAQQAAALCAPRPQGQRHRLVAVPLDGLRRALESVEQETGVRLSTMGRGLDEDEAAFLAAAAAGRYAASVLEPEAQQVRPYPAPAPKTVGGDSEPRHYPVRMKTFEDLFAELQGKAASRPQGSGTVAELDHGVHFIGKKIVEEAAEAWMACEHESDEAACAELSQLLYHVQVMMIAKGYSLQDVYRYL